jgi:glycosyltransferase involved in cell wall biosynthesis
MNDDNNQLDFSILIPCYNNFDGLLLAIRSIHYHPDRFIIVVIDDGSTIPISINLISDKINPHYKIIIFRNKINSGITNALNIGLHWIQTNNKSKYIARLDCGDICDEERFFKQLAYMENNPDVGLLGSWCIFEDKKKKYRYHYKTPAIDKKIHRAMHFKNVFIHPTVLFRAALLEKAGYYPVNFLYAEDYAFFWQLIKIRSCHIIEEYLMTCEINESGISLSNRRRQLYSRMRVVAAYGTNIILQFVGIMKLCVIYLAPKSFVLALKNKIKRQ